jgi:hypothetical protein
VKWTRKLFVRRRRSPSDLRGLERWRVTGVSRLSIAFGTILMVSLAGCLPLDVLPDRMECEEPCPEGYYCDDEKEQGESWCEPKRELGAWCSSDEECLSDVCDRNTCTRECTFADCEGASVCAGRSVLDGCAHACVREGCGIGDYCSPEEGCLPATIVGLGAACSDEQTQCARQLKCVDLPLEGCCSCTQACSQADVGTACAGGIGFCDERSPGHPYCRPSCEALDDCHAVNPSYVSCAQPAGAPAKLCYFF